MKKTRLSHLRTGDKFSFDPMWRNMAIFDHAGANYYAFKWNTNNFFEPLQRGKNDCEVWVFSN